MSNKKETQSWQAAMLPEHAPLSWKLPACSQGQHSQRSSPAMEPHVEVPPEKPLQGPLTFLQDLLLGWALTIFFLPELYCTYAHSWLGTLLIWIHMDLTSWPDLGFTSSPCYLLSSLIQLLTCTFGWRLSTDLSWLPSSGTVDLALFGVMALCLPCCWDIPALWYTLSLLNYKSTSAIMLEGKKKL